MRNMGPSGCESPTDLAFKRFGAAWKGSRLFAVQRGLTLGGFAP